MVKVLFVPLNKPKWRNGVCINIRGKAFKLITTGMTLAAFVWQISFSVSNYLQRRTIFTVREITDPPALFPPITVCPWPSFDPLRLVSLGLNISVDSGEKLNSNYENLAGIDDRMTGRTLVEEAAWHLEDIVEEVNVGDIHEVYDAANQGKPTQLWHRSYTPLGPCFTMMPPTLASLTSKNLAVKVRPHPLGPDMCTWKDNGTIHKYQSLEGCLHIKSHCNTSCAWEQFVSGVLYSVNLVYLGSSSISLNIHHKSTDKSILHFRNLQYEVHPYVILRNSNTRISSTSCFYECLVKSGTTKGNCSELSEKTLDRPLHNLCITQHQQYYVSIALLTESDAFQTCKRFCKPDKKELWWELRETPLNTQQMQDALTLVLSSTDTKEIREIDVYPLSHLMSDIGGSLGLLLGISLLCIWKGFVTLAKYLLEKISGSSTSDPYLHLSKLFGAFTISIMACTHLGISIFQFVNQPVYSAVGLKTSGNAYSVTMATGLNTSIGNQNLEFKLTLQNIVLAYLSSRPLGCRLLSGNSQMECFAKCIMQDDIIFPIPLQTTDDLPPCSKDHLTLPNIKFIAESHFMHQLEKHQKKKMCSFKCINSTSNNIDNATSVAFDVEDKLLVSKSSFICTIGGIIGLYYGFCLLGIFLNINALIQTIFGGELIYKAINLGVKFIIFFICVMFIILQLQSFMLDHPVTTSVSSRYLELQDLPVVTVCLWPPFNVKRILEAAGLGEEYAQTVSQNPQNNSEAILRLLQRLAETSNNTSPSNLWSIASHSDEMEIRSRSGLTVWECRNCLKNFSTNFANCYTYSSTISSKNIDKGHFLTLRISQPSAVYISLHNRDDIPVMNPDQRIEGHEEIHIQRFGSWSGLQGDVRGRGRCLSECLDGALATRMGCAFPWSASRTNAPSCGMEQFAEFVSALWSLGTRPRFVYAALLGSNVTSMCSQKCHQKYGKFYSFLFHNRLYSGQTLTLAYASNQSDLVFDIFFMSEMFESVAAHDSYPIAQLVSEIGGVVGMTLGISLASLMEAVAGAARHLFRIPTFY